LAKSGDIELFRHSEPFLHILSYWKVKDGKKQYLIISSQSDESMKDAKQKLIENITKAYETFNQEVQ
jgi:hypothetical protein